jgi:hypothetical protein
MKRSPGPRVPSSNLSESVQRRLNGYALAAAAAGVGLLTLSSPSEAEIVYTPVHEIGFRYYLLDLNNDGVPDFTLLATEACDGSRCKSWLEIYSAPSQNAVAGKSQFAAVLWPGAKIGPKRAWGATLIERASTISGTRSGFYGPWANGGKGFKGHYLGLKFHINGQFHYGWARLTTTGGWPRSAILTGYAYETIPGKSIIAGQTKEALVESDYGAGASLANPLPDTPLPGSLGMLALGAQDVPLWRRKESAVEGVLVSDAGGKRWKSQEAFSLVSTTGKVGKTIEVLGQGFTGTTGVSFNGTAATFAVVSDTYLTTMVPSGATSGFVTVTTPGGTLTSNK